MRARGPGVLAVVLSGAALALSVAPGCTAHDAPAPLSERNLVQLEVSYSRALDSNAPVRLDAEAHFVRYRATALEEPGVAALLGLLRDDDLAMGTCRAEVDGPLVLSGTGLEVALLDAGSLTIKNDGTVETTLAPQRYPELLPFVNGVVYGSEGAEGHEPTATGRFEVEAAGGDDVGPFTATATLSRGFPNLSVTRRGRAIELTWAAGSSIGQSVLVELHVGGAHASTVHCRAVDEGHLDLSRIVTPAALGLVDEALASGATAQVGIARVEQAALDAPGAGSGRLLVTLRDTAAIPTSP